ncbi:secretin and TonB N-terminal domain-containing protein [Uliginosibacterium gangwonense]|uniref:secretin and TonB N-terminal domain-containing protein n=1 Tax=Uliginosibacterium gangwonense TaxID=392736 RepID=UPI000374C51C|nr:secretin and TonB N-terminal domain-containing protein [Uliginosibacterium gangwonense]
MPMHSNLSVRFTHLANFIVCLLLTGCAANVIDSSREMLETGHNENAISMLESELKQHPDNREARVYYYRVRDQLVNQSLVMAERALSSGQTDEAEEQIQRAFRYEPDNARARSLVRRLESAKRRAQRMEEARKLLSEKHLPEAEGIARALLAENPNDAAVRVMLRSIDEQVAANNVVSEETHLKDGFKTPITLEFREVPLRSVFEVISRTSGINFVFDKDVRTDTKVTIFVRNTSIDEVVSLVLKTSQLEKKLLNENSVIIYPSSQGKQKDYQELVTRTFYLTNTEAKQAQALIKSVVKSKDTFIDESLNILVIKDTPEAVRMAERLIAQLDIAAPEVMLEVEVLEVARSKLLSLGVKYPDQVGYGILQPTTTSVVTTSTGSTASTNLGGQLLNGNIALTSTNGLVGYVTNPGLLLNLKDQDGISNTLANPRIRVHNKEKAKILVGDRVPVFTTTSTANVGVAASVNYLDVGLKLEVEPTVRLDDQVEIKVALEVSSISKEVTGPQSTLAYQIGTRNANTVLRLHDGETQVLAGLISDAERHSTASIPGLGRIPALGWLFSTHSNDNSKTEIILLITPHVVSNVIPEASARAVFPAGTESDVGSPPLSITSLSPAGVFNVKQPNKGGAPTVKPQGTHNSTAPAAISIPITGESARSNPTTVTPKDVSNTPVATPVDKAPNSSGEPPKGVKPNSSTSNERDQAATQSDSPADKPALTNQARLWLSGPTVAMAGQDLTVSVTATSIQPITSNEVVLNYDKNVFESTSSDEAEGIVKMVTTANGAVGQLHLKVKPGIAAKPSPILFSRVNVTTDQGVAPVELGQALVVQISAAQQ